MDDIIIEIKDSEVVERTSSNDRGSFTFREQKGWAHLPGVPYPKEITLSLEQNFVGYAPGNYLLTDANFEVNRFNQLGLKRYLNLTATKQSPKVKAA